MRQADAVADLLLRVLQLGGGPGRPFLVGDCRTDQEPRAQGDGQETLHQCSPCGRCRGRTRETPRAKAMILPLLARGRQPPGGTGPRRRTVDVGPCPRQESNLVLDLRRVVCDVRHTPRTMKQRCHPPPGNRTRPCGFEDRRASATLAGKQPVPLPGVEPGLRPSEGRVPSVTLQGRSRSRRPGSNRHEPAYKAGASPFGHVGGEQGRKDSNPVDASFGGSLLSQEHAPEKGPGRRAGAMRLTSGQGRAGSSARNRDQLAIPDALRRVRAASTSGRAGRFRRCMPACSGVRSALRALHGSQAATQLVQLDTPPCERGTTWSTVIASPAGLGAAVLAGVVVALGHVPPAEGHRRRRAGGRSGPGRPPRGPAAGPVPTGCTGGRRGPAPAPPTPPSRRGGTRPARRPAPISFQSMTSARTTVVTWIGCQLRFRTSVGSSRTLRVIVASAKRVTMRVSGGS